MANCLMCWPDHVMGTGYKDTVLSGGSWLSSLPLTNLQDPALATLARSTNAAKTSTIIDADLGIGRAGRVITLIRHNISSAGTVRITISEAADYSDPVYQSDWIAVWPVFYEFGSLPWGYPGVWSGVLGCEETDGYTMNFVHVLSADTWARYWRIEIDDEDNPDGYVELARAGIWSAWQPDLNLQYGNTLGWQTDTPADQALSGARYFDRRNPRREMVFSIDLIDPDTALQKPFEMARKLGIDGQLYFIYDPDDDPPSMFRRSFLATLRELSPLQYPMYHYAAQAFALREVL